MSANTNPDFIHRFIPSPKRDIPSFFRRLAEGVFDLEDLKLRTREWQNFCTRCIIKVIF
jgi:hypothetical protein